MEQRFAPAIGGAIELRVSDISQLFDTLDPYPFPERDLDKDAEEFIVGWARELPHGKPLKIVVHLPEAELNKQDGNSIRAAINRYFDYRVEVIGRDLKELFRIGRLSLVIGLTVLAVALAVTQLVGGRLNPTPLARFLGKGLRSFLGGVPEDRGAVAG